MACLQPVRMTTTSPARSEVFYNLSAVEQRCYMDKIALIEGLDPYTIPASQLSEDASALPSLSHGDITVYLLHTTSFVTLEEVKNYKSLGSYKYFIAGWVTFHKWKHFKDTTVIIGKVNHSYAVSSPPLRPWVIVRNDGTVVCGHCTCMAGLCETCSHVGALLYWVEYQVRIRDETSCTSMSNTWLEPRAITNVPYMQLKDINFSSAEKQIEILEKASVPAAEAAVPSTSAMQQIAPSDSELKQLFDACHSSEIQPVLFSVLDKPYCDFFSKSADHLPMSLQTIFRSEYLKCDYFELVDIGTKIELKATSLQQQHLEELTRMQSKSKLWMKYRSGRITSSRFFQAVHTDLEKPSQSLVVSICYPESITFTSAATRYGLEHEKKAINDYKSLQILKHSDFVISPSGFMISTKKPCFGASPDSFVECSCCGKGLVEVKCPYSAKSLHFDQLVKKSGFCLRKVDEDSTLMLKRNHPYYYQCQLHLMASELVYCDFVVWTPHGEVHTERIYSDEHLLASALPKAEMLFSKVVLPELLGKWLTRVPLNDSADMIDYESDDDGSWCYCKQSKGGPMIGCANSLCGTKWFHMDCLKLKVAPRGKWLCSDCNGKN